MSSLSLGERSDGVAGLRVDCNTVAEAGEKAGELDLESSTGGDIMSAGVYYEARIQCSLYAD